MRENESEDLPLDFIDGGLLTVKGERDTTSTEVAAPGQRLEEVCIVRGPRKRSGLLLPGICCWLLQLPKNESFLPSI